MKKTELIAVRTSVETKLTLEKIAEKEDRSISYIVNRIIQDFIKNNINENQK